MLKRGIMLAGLFLATLAVSAPWANSQDSGETRTPAYNQAPPAKGAKLPALLTKDQLWGDNAQYPFQTHAYELAAKIQPRNRRKVMCTRTCVPAMLPIVMDQGMGNLGLAVRLSGSHAGSALRVAMPP